VVLIAIGLVFGPSRLPGLARSLGQAVHELRAGMREAPASDEADR
jgi:TatA/E family protein of Tat protein translocase